MASLQISYQMQTINSLAFNQTPCGRLVHRTRVLSVQCAAVPAAGPGKIYIDPTEKQVSAFAPATVANLGPGFDWMGCAVDVSYQ